eukprot:TRINITY_DN15176_c0_g1_i1.p1 TRINITY_DN15176_c0_g1~~TRINITY_DN15176_c0_g1_i1.p1  ORF type:complete len:311 (-),score=54.55 TRINITY_DN15176_c0_g1_i1:167-1099(-)
MSNSITSRNKRAWTSPENSISAYKAKWNSNWGVESDTFGPIVVPKKRPSSTSKDICFQNKKFKMVQVYDEEQKVTVSQCSKPQVQAQPQVHGKEQPKITSSSSILPSKQPQTVNLPGLPTYNRNPEVKQITVSQLISLPKVVPPSSISVGLPQPKLEIQTPNLISLAALAHPKIQSNVPIHPQLQFKVPKAPVQIQHQPPQTVQLLQRKPLQPHSPQSLNSMRSPKQEIAPEARSLSPPALLYPSQTQLPLQPQLQPQVKPLSPNQPYQKFLAQKPQEFNAQSCQIEEQPKSVKQETEQIRVKFHSPDQS